MATEEGSGSAGAGTSETAAAAACVPALSDDLILEILLRVPDLVSVFRCSVVCKRWRRLLGDPGFLGRRAWPDSALLGFFVQRERLSATARRKIPRLSPTRAPAFVPAPGSHLGPERRLLTSFIRDDDGLLDDAETLVARGGLLLLRVSPRPGDKDGLLRLCVCNLFTGKRDLLPPITFSRRRDVHGFAILTAADHGAGPHQPADGYSTFFQVLFLELSQLERKLNLFKFCSSAAAPPTWYSQDCKRFGVQVYLAHLRCYAATVARGTVHWLFRGFHQHAPGLYTLDVCAITGRASATLLPFDVPFWAPWLTTTIDERLLLFYMRNNNHLMVWKHGDGDQVGDQVGTPVWRFTNDFTNGPQGRIIWRATLSCVRRSREWHCTCTLYYAKPGRAYMLDLQSGSATKVEGWREAFDCMTAVPYEINWPLFFMSRLGLQP